MTDPTGLFILLGGIVLCSGAVVLWDWLAERERLRKRRRDQSV